MRALSSYVRVNIAQNEAMLLCLRCSDGYLKLYLRGQELNMYEKHDADLCSNNATSVYWSEGPKFSMIFSSGQTQGSGFKARFQFATGKSICCLSCGLIDLELD